MMPNKVELVPHWRLAWRYWSLRFAAIAASIQFFLTQYPDAALQAWANLPPDIKGYLPPNYLAWVSGFLMTLSLIARIVRQPKVETKIAVKEAIEAGKEEGFADAENQNTASSNSIFPTILAIGALLLFGAVSSEVEAQVTFTTSGANCPASTPSNLACVQWVAPTTNTDGSPLTDLTAFRIVYGNASNNLDKYAAIPSPTTKSATFKGLANGTWYFAVRAINSVGTESANSQVSNAKTISPIQLVPSPPTMITVAPTQAYQVIGTPDKFVLLAVGTVPADTQCISSQSVNGHNAVPVSSVTFYGNVKPKVVVAKCSG